MAVLNCSCIRVSKLMYTCAIAECISLLRAVNSSSRVNARVKQHASVAAGGFATGDASARECSTICRCGNTVCRRGGGLGMRVILLERVRI